MKHCFLLFPCLLALHVALAQDKDTVIYKGIPKAVLCSNFVLINMAHDQVRVLMSFDRTRWDTVFMKSRSSRFFEAKGNNRCYVRFGNKKYILRPCLEHVLYKKENSWDLFSQ